MRSSHSAAVLKIWANEDALPSCSTLTIGAGHGYLTPSLPLPTPFNRSVCSAGSAALSMLIILLAGCPPFLLNCGNWQPGKEGRAKAKGRSPENEVQVLERLRQEEALLRVVVRDVAQLAHVLQPRVPRLRLRQRAQQAAVSGRLHTATVCPQQRGGCTAALHSIARRHVPGSRRLRHSSCRVMLCTLPCSTVYITPHHRTRLASRRWQAALLAAGVVRLLTSCRPGYRRVLGWRRTLIPHGMRDMEPAHLLRALRRANIKQCPPGSTLQAVHSRRYTQGGTPQAAAHLAVRLEGKEHLPRPGAVLLVLGHAPHVPAQRAMHALSPMLGGARP